MRAVAWTLELIDIYVEIKKKKKTNKKNNKKTINKQYSIKATRLGVYA